MCVFVREREELYQRVSKYKYNQNERPKPKPQYKIQNEYMYWRIKQRWQDTIFVYVYTLLTYVCMYVCM